MNPNISAIRKNYSQKSLSENEVAISPIKQFGVWWQEAMAAGIDEVNAMTLATSSADGMPSARIVLLKGFSEEGFHFYTNYNSYKSQQLAENPKACLVFFWKELERQVRITGLVGKLSEAESNTYFASRPTGSQLGAIISPQSQVISSRDWLEKQYEKLEQQVKEDAIERPGYWGGYVIKPVIIEFWQGRSNRLHDRIQYSLMEDSSWKIERLAP